MGSYVSSCCDSSNKFDNGVNVFSRGSNSWRIFTYKELHAATNGFSEENKLGEGGFGSVYWGKTSDGLQIAMKKLKVMNSKTKMEFAVEVEVLGRVWHKTLLGLGGYCVGTDQRLIVYDYMLRWVWHKTLLGLGGYCVGTDQRLIVYDYMPNLSLLSHLHGQFGVEIQLDWKKRINIAIGSAEGLLYLHHEVSPHIIHRDIKASNVLLDSNFQTLVADFGFAKLIPEGVSHLTTRVKGTLGYLAPEYAMWGKVSESCDVYSFGIFLLEIVTGRKPIEKLPGGVKRTITEWAAPLITMKQAIEVASLRVRSDPDKRPNMKEVVSLLKGHEPKGTVLQMKINSVKYEEAFLALDQHSDDDGADESNGYGIFSALEEQKMQDPYKRHGDWRITRKV